MGSLYSDRTLAAKCHHVSRITLNDCWHELIKGSVRTPLIEFEMVVYNAVLNLGLEAQGPDGWVPELLRLDGWPQGDGNRRPIYPPYAKEAVSKEISPRGNWDDYVGEFV